MTVYASVDELSDYLPDDVELPSDAARRLARASEYVDWLACTAVYDVDEDGPTDALVLDALKRATLAQCAWWIETGDESGAAAALSGGSIGGQSWSGQVPRTAPDAVRVLQSAVSSTGARLLTGLLMP